MKFIETATRECCEFKDMKVYYGEQHNRGQRKIYFCKQCGQLWVWDEKRGGGLVRIKI